MHMSVGAVTGQLLVRVEPLNEYHQNTDCKKRYEKNSLDLDFTSTSESISITWFSSENLLKKFQTKTSLVQERGKFAGKLRQGNARSSLRIKRENSSV